MFKVFVPTYVATNYRNEDGETIYNVRMKYLGEAIDMEDARKYTRYPILQEVK